MILASTHMANHLACFLTGRQHTPLYLILDDKFR